MTNVLEVIKWYSYYILLITFEALTQEESSQVPLTIAHSISTSIIHTVPSTQSQYPVPTESSIPTVAISQPINLNHQSTVSNETITHTTPIRIPSLPPNRLNGDGEVMPRLATRMSAQMMALLERSDSLLMPYRERMEEIECREREKKEKEKEKEKGKENEMEVEGQNCYTISTLF